MSGPNSANTMAIQNHCINCKWHKDGYCLLSPPAVGPERLAPIELRYPAVRPENDGPCYGYAPEEGNDVNEAGTQ